MGTRQQSNDTASSKPMTSRSPSSPGRTSSWDQAGKRTEARAGGLQTRRSFNNCKINDHVRDRLVLGPSCEDERAD